MLSKRTKLENIFNTIESENATPSWKPRSTELSILLFMTGLHLSSYLKTSDFKIQRRARQSFLEG